MGILAAASRQPVSLLFAVVRRNEHRTVTLDPECVALMLDEAWRRWPMETGGLLLGAPGLIRQVVGPGPAATHGPTGFEPDHSWQADQVDRRWRRDPSIDYLGDWHTHPKGRPVPSPLDRSTMRDIAAHPPARQPRPLMLIAALDSSGEVRWGAYRLDIGAVRKVRLAIPNEPPSDSR